MYKALPVYRNLEYIQENSLRGQSLYFSEAQMQERAEKAAAALHTEISEHDVTYVREMTSANYTADILNSPFTFHAKCSDRTNLTVYGNGRTEIVFHEKTLPEQYHFTLYDTTNQQADDVLSYFAEEYAALFGFSNPAGYSYTLRDDGGKARRCYVLYERSEKVGEDIADFSRTAVQLIPDAAGNLQTIRLAPDARAAELLGDYPIISAEQAEELLLSGGAFSTVPAEQLSGGTVAKEDIVKTGIVYLENAYSQPFYKFYVELDASKTAALAENLRTFGVFYVPAVETAYLEGSETRISVQ